MAFSAQYNAGQVQTVAAAKTIHRGPKKQPVAQQQPRCQPQRMNVAKIAILIGWQTPWARLAFFATFCRDDKK
jgi:hypothetical protein